MAEKKTKADLAYAVHLDKEVYGPGEAEVPDKVLKRMGAHCFVDGKHPLEKQSSSAKQQREAGTPPPRAGAGSGVDEWRAYAGEVEVDVADDAGRDDVIAAIAAAGKPVEPQQ